MKVILNLGSKN